MFVLFALSASAQRLTVESFQLRSNDLSARKNQRVDLNGKPCALLKVMVLDNVTKCSSGNIGDIITEGPVKLIYVTQATRSIELSFQYHYPITITFADYGFNSLEGASTYEVALVEARQTAPPASSQQVQAGNVASNGLSLDGITNPVLVNLVRNMVRVEGGTFMMGAPEEQRSVANDSETPVHQVTLSGYYIGKYEVTQEEWQAVMGSNPSYNKGSGKLPVESVCWDDCQEFIRKLNSLTGKNFRLPTEAEWEYAARGGNKSRGYKYAGSDNIDDVAWNGDNANGRTREIGGKQPNELGLYDMSGNVWEWCSDWYCSYSSSPQTNPIGASAGSYRVYRGGSCNFNDRLCRVSFRGYATPSSSKYISIGLRLVL